MATDSADWTQTVTLTDISGTPISAGGVSANTMVVEFLTAGTSQSFTGNITSLHDNQTHFVTSLYVWFCMTNSVGPGVPSYGTVQVVDVVSGLFIATVPLVYNTAGGVPEDQTNSAAITFPGGYQLQTPGSASYRLGWNVQFLGAPLSWTLNYAFVISAAVG